MQERITVKSIEKAQNTRPFIPLADELKKVSIAMQFCNELSLSEMEALRNFAFFKKVPNV